MLPLQFFGQNLHYALDLFFSLILFAVFWLYFDAWTASKKIREVYKWFGFLLLSLSFLIQATLIEQSVLGSSFFGDYTVGISVGLRLFGYLSIVVSQLIDPIQSVPDNKGLNLGNKTAKNLLVFGNLFINLKFILPLGALSLALLYFRRATTGLERHLKSIALAFFLLSVSELFALAMVFRTNPNIDLHNLTAAFGPLWLAEQFFLLLSAVVLGKWVWSYLVKRLQNQLFMIFTTAVLLIFLIISVSFTFLLIGNIQKDSLASLETASKVLNLNIESKRAETAANAEVFSQNPDIKDAVRNKDHNRLNLVIGATLEAKKLSSLIIISSNGMVLARAEEPDRWGDSLSSDPLVKKALIGKDVSNLVSKDSVLAPVIFLQTAKPIVSSGQVIGTVVASIALNNNFLDGIKNSTGLDSAIYAKNLRSATTLLAPDGKERQIGVKETSSAINKQVLGEGKTFSGSLQILNQPFLAVYQPLKNINNEVIGMSFTGEPQVAILKDSGKSVEFSFFLSALLLVLSVFPSLWISRYITKQLH